MTNLEIIGAALRLLNVIAETETPSAEQGATGLAVLNDMLEDWAGRSIDVGQWPQSDLTAEFPGPTTVEGVCKANLAVWLAPYYSAPLRPEVVMLASSGYSRLLREAMLAQLHPATMTHLHQGEGQWATEVITE